jgi:hypothetical protein|tara:strand:+ start:533 stop:910 length:378 start_codon:yes stop_codon:yes gene_type:complete
MTTKINPNKKIEVYFNLHKKTWSVRQSGKVVQHTDFICVRDPQYVVRQTGKEKVRREKRKNVHAFVRGYVENRLPVFPKKNTFVTYNPYKNDSFVERNTNDSICSSPFAALEIVNKKPFVEALWY